MPAPMHHAKLVVHKLPSLPKRDRMRIAEWLEKVAKEIRTEDPEIFARVFTARLMK